MLFLLNQYIDHHIDFIHIIFYIIKYFVLLLFFFSNLHRNNIKIILYKK